MSPTPEQMRAQAGWLIATGNHQEAEVTLASAQDALDGAEAELARTGAPTPVPEGERAALHGQARALRSEASILEREAAIFDVRSARKAAQR